MMRKWIVLVVAFALLLSFATVAGAASEPKFVQVVSGTADHTLGLTDNGQVYAWGNNEYGQLGDGTTTDRNVPVNISAIPTSALHGKTVKQLATGGAHSLALTTDGQVYAWGWNRYGQLGDSTTTDRSLPTTIADNFPPGVTIMQLGCGETHSFALGDNGSVYAWGDNYYGQLGDGTTSDRPAAITVNFPAGTRITQITGGGYYSIARTSDGQVYAWGYNSTEGYLGDGTMTDRSLPVNISAISGSALYGKTIKQIAVGSGHSLALTDDGQVCAWGQNFTAQLGDGTTTRRRTPINISSYFTPAAANIVQIACGAVHSLALGDEGQVYTWGYGYSGRLGNNSASWHYVPTDISANFPAGTIVAQIFGGANHSLALTDDGQLYAWGWSYYGQAGKGSKVASNDRLPWRVAAQVWQSVPTSGTVGVPLSTNLSVSFDRPMRADLVGTITLTASGEATILADVSAATWDDATAANPTVTVPVSGLLPNTTYTATVEGWAPATLDPTIYPNHPYHFSFTTGNGYVVSFDTNSGSFGDGSTLVEVGLPTSNSGVGSRIPSDPSRTDWDFLGWAYSPLSTTPDFDADAAISANVTVYAVWDYNPAVYELSTTTTLIPGSVVNEATLSFETSSTHAATVYFTVNDGLIQVYDPTNPYELPEGVNDIAYWAEDSRGHVENIHIMTITVDKTPPVTTVAQAGGTYYVGDVALSLSATDPISGGVSSGVDATYYTIVGPGFDTLATTRVWSGTPVTFSSAGIYTVTYWSVDAVGNVEDVQTVVYTVANKPVPPKPPVVEPEEVKPPKPQKPVKLPDAGDSVSIAVIAIMLVVGTGLAVASTRKRA